MNRTVFLADGFNLYHSLVQAQIDGGGTTTKWLDLRSLCSSFLPLIGRISSERATLERIYYFSAPPTHRSQDKQARHAIYMRCLRGTSHDYFRYALIRRAGPECGFYQHYAEAIRKAGQPQRG